MAEKSAVKEAASSNSESIPVSKSSNPIMVQVVFLSALAGVEIAEAAAQAAVNLLYKVNHTTACRGGSGSLE